MLGQAGAPLRQLSDLRPAARLPCVSTGGCVEANSEHECAVVFCLQNVPIFLPISHDSLGLRALSKLRGAFPQAVVCYLLAGAPNRTFQVKWFYLAFQPCVGARLSISGGCDDLAF